MLGQQIGASAVSPEPLRDDARVSFGPFVLDRNERTLQRHHAEIALPERSLRLLEVLVRSAGQTVSKDRLVEEVWRGTCVSDTSLTEAMSRLRHTLEDEAREPRYIRTVHGRGYKFISPIRKVGRHSGNSSKTAWVSVQIAASIAFLAALWIGSVVVGSSHEPRGSSAGFLADRPAMASDALQRLSGSLLGFLAADTTQVRRRFRLAEVATNSAQTFKYGLPALPLGEFSADRTGNRLAFSIAEGQQSQVWVLEPRKGEFKRITSVGYFSDPVWSPNGHAVALAHRRNGNFDLVVKEVDRARPAQVLLEAPLDQFPESWSQDGRSLLYSELHPETGYDLWLLHQRSDDSWVPTPLVRTANDEAFGAISPNGRYVAYTSSAGQGPDVFVVDLNSNRTTFRVSGSGGAYPFWSTTGDRLHYVNGDEVWTVATDQIDGDVTRASRTSTVPGLYLAANASAADRIVVAMLE